MYVIQITNIDNHEMIPFADIATNSKYFLFQSNGDDVLSTQVSSLPSRSSVVCIKFRKL